MDRAFPHIENIPRTLQLERVGRRYELAFVDQRLLPSQLIIRRTSDWREVVSAIQGLAVRGAPAIGLAGASALCLWLASQREETDGDGLLASFDSTVDQLVKARPTAVNLEWAVRRVAVRPRSLIASGRGLACAVEALAEGVWEMQREDEQVNRLIGKIGAQLIREPSNLLTHCNAGSLATSYYGTALGVVYSAAAAGNVKRVFADETRPVGQGARLTAWELSRARVPVTLICDNMAASLMAAGKVDAVVVGADRIAANGDVANKIGTYGLAVLAREHAIPFYVAAPASTFDPSTPDGSCIPIEQRPASEVLPEPIEGVEVWNPSFDVTPARLITKLITEQGAFDPSEAARALGT